MYQFLFKRHKDFHTHVGTLSSVKLVPQGAVAGFQMLLVVEAGDQSIHRCYLQVIKFNHAMPLVQCLQVNFCNTFNIIKFYYLLGFTQINWWFVIALSIGGMIAAPISAYLTKILPINILAICVGGLIIFTNSNALMTYFIKDTTVINVIRFAIICAIIVLVIITIIRNKNCLFLINKTE